MIHIFIVNHYAGSKDLAKDLRAYLQQKKDLRYFVFNSVSGGFEAVIARKIKDYFKGEKLRFYCCGGSGTIRNVLNGLEDLSEIEVAFFPCGLTNDFLKCFDDDYRFRQINHLINGRVVEIDYIKSNCGVALNTLSVGYDANVVKYMDDIRIYEVLGKQFPYLLSILKGIVFAGPRRVELSIDGEVTTEYYSQIIFGNGCVFGGNIYFSEYTDVTDGVASYLTVNKARGLEAVIMLVKLMQKGLANLKGKVKHGECKTIEIKSLDGKPIFVNFDGELVECGTECKAEIVQKGLHFVIPQNVEIIPFQLNKGGEADGE